MQVWPGSQAGGGISDLIFHFPTLPSAPGMQRLCPNTHTAVVSQPESSHG